MMLSAQALGAIRAGKLHVSVDENGYETIVAAHGELDSATAATLHSVLDRVGRRDGLIRLDLSGVRFMDSAGLHLMQDAYERATAGDSTLAIGPVSEAVAHVIDITRTEHLVAL